MQQEMNMTDDITKGKLNQIKGRATEKAGKLAGDSSREIKGMTEQIAGKIQEEYGKAKREIKKTLDD
jgi:uncharacterized protein YjbJ (UPF0337 family)